MKVILYMAISINGHITHGEDDSDWVSQTDWAEFDKLKRESKVMIMGGRTLEQFEDDFPQEGALNVVMTHNRELLKKNTPNALYSDQSPTEILKTLEAKGFTQVMLIGGMTLNTSFVKENLIDEVWLSLHPLFIGKGKTLTQELDVFFNLEFLESKELEEGLIQLRYKLI
jgi:dihydrofolate reductase